MASSPRTHATPTTTPRASSARRHLLHFVVPPEAVERALLALDGEYHTVQAVLAEMLRQGWDGHDADHPLIRRSTLSIRLKRMYDRGQLLARIRTGMGATGQARAYEYKLPANAAELAQARDIMAASEAEAQVVEQAASGRAPLVARRLYEHRVDHPRTEKRASFILNRTVLADVAALAATSGRRRDDVVNEVIERGLRALAADVDGDETHTPDALRTRPHARVLQHYA